MKPDFKELARVMLYGAYSHEQVGSGLLADAITKLAEDAFEAGRESGVDENFKMNWQHGFEAGQRSILPDCPYTVLVGESCPKCGRVHREAPTPQEQEKSE
jgi:sugar/nucleoside kinase (ribokinase family)